MIFLIRDKGKTGGSIAPADQTALLSDANRSDSSIKQ